MAKERLKYAQLEPGAFLSDIEYQMMTAELLDIAVGCVIGMAGMHANKQLNFLSVNG